VKEENPVFKNPVWANIKINANQKYFGTVYYPGHGRATEEGRRTGFPLRRYGCQLRASVLEHSSIWRNGMITYKPRVESVRAALLFRRQQNPR
jgi:hypothetical protein